MTLSDSNPLLQSFRAVHSALWNRTDRLSSIIYQVTVTSADFDEVQNRLNSHNGPSRALDEYNAGTRDPAIESIKLGVIHDVVTRNAGDVTFHVLDLRTLQLPHALFGMQVILAREEYWLLADSILKNSHSIFRTGQPGIG